MLPASNRHRVLSALHLSALLIIAGVSGCGSSHDGRLPLAGTVLVNGASSVDGGTLVFSPEAGTQSPAAAFPLKEGTFSVGGDKGVRPGSFKVTLRFPVGERKGPVPAFSPDAPAGPLLEQAMANAPPPAKSLETNVDVSADNCSELTLLFVDVADEE